LDSQGNYLFGDDAEDNRATDGAGYVSRFKRDLQTNVPKHIHGRTITPVELTAKFLTHVRERVEEEALHGPVGHAVITVPALYGPAAKANLKEAVKQAGFTDFDLLDEPVAAGFAFLHDNPDFAKGQTFLALYHPCSDSCLSFRKRKSRLATPQAL
jgi:molecular chaperone DnaK